MTDQLRPHPPCPRTTRAPTAASRERTRPVDPEVVERLLAAEWARFTSWSGESGAHNERASKSLPLGVTSSFQHWDPYPISIASAPRARGSPTSTATSCSTCRWASAPCSSGTSTRTSSRRSTRGAHRHRHAVRHAVAAGDRDERAVLRPVPARHDPVHQLGHRVADVRHPLRARLHRAQGDREDRGRLPRRLRRPPGLGQAGARRDRPGRRARPRRCPSTSRPERCTSSPTTTSSSSTGCSPSTAARSPPWWSSRSSRTCRSWCPTRATSPACARRATPTASCSSSTR